MKTYPAQIPILTSLRFFAALWVVLYHYVWWLTPPGLQRLDVPLVAQGYLAVDFFFILSGFILTHAHCRPIAETTLRSGPFLVRRLARIYPLHLATLLFYLALIVIAKRVGMHLPNPERYTSGQFFLNLLLLHAMQIRDVGGWNYPSWSISAEWFAYLFFPAISAGIVRGLARWSAPTLLLLGIATLLAFYRLSDPVLGTSFFALHSNFGWYRILPEFVAGVLLYRVGRECDLAWLNPRFMLWLVLAAILAACVLQAAMVAVLMFGLLILVAAETSRRAHEGGLACPGLVYLGKISFALYMVHLPVATLMLKGAPTFLGMHPATMLVPSIGSALAVAAAAHHVIEAPAYGWIVALSRKKNIRAKIDGAPGADVSVLDSRIGQAAE